MTDNQTARPLAKEIVTLLRRLVDADGKLLRYQINPETDAETIVRAESGGYVDRHFKPTAWRDVSKLMGVSITDAGRRALDGEG